MRTHAVRLPARHPVRSFVLANWSAFVTARAVVATIEQGCVSAWGGFFKLAWSAPVVGVFQHACPREVAPDGSVGLSGGLKLAPFGQAMADGLPAWRHRAGRRDRMWQGLLWQGLLRLGADGFALRRRSWRPHVRGRRVVLLQLSGSRWRNRDGGCRQTRLLRMGDHSWTGRQNRQCGRNAKRGFCL